MLLAVHCPTSTGEHNPCAQRDREPTCRGLSSRVLLEGALLGPPGVFLQQVHHLVLQDLKSGLGLLLLKDGLLGQAAQHAQLFLQLLVDFHQLNVLHL